jgi:hypothetical protein
LAITLTLSSASNIIATKYINPLLDRLNRPTPTPYPVVTRTPTPLTKTTPTILPPTPTTIKKVVTKCNRINIREGEFASNKCYSQVDYDNLNYYLVRYNSAKFELQIADGSISITCNCRVPQECEFFKQSCADARQKKSTAESNIAKYRATIQTIIGRGK